MDDIDMGSNSMAWDGDAQVRGVKLQMVQTEFGSVMVKKFADSIVDYVLFWTVLKIICVWMQNVYPQTNKPWVWFFFN